MVIRLITVTASDCLMLGAQSSVSVNSQDVTQHKPQHQGYQPSLPSQQSPYVNQPGISFRVN